MRIINQHIPKTATQTTQALFGKNIINYGRHRLNADIPNDPNILSFTIIREPLSRFKSCIKMFFPSCNYSESEIIDIALYNNYNNNEYTINWKEIDRAIATHSLSIFHPYLNVFENNSFKSKYLIDFNNFAKELKLIIPNANYKNIPVINKGISREIRLSYTQKIDFENKFERDLEFYEIFLKCRRR